MRVAVIPARGGSKRIPGKNIRLFHGKPMLAWPLTVALQSGCFDRIIVSTDDEAIAEIARAHGAEVPFMRPAALSGDQVATQPVIAHAIQWLQSQATGIDAVCCIYATAPFITAADLHRGYELLHTAGCDYVFSVASYAFPIQRAVRITASGGVEMFQPEHFNTRSQDLEPAYHDAAQFYWGRPESWLAAKPVFSPAARAVIVPRFRVADIDTPEDWAQAELMFEALQRTPG
jgi:pseudaminic acid cytidylyltransferase